MTAMPITMMRRLTRTEKRFCPGMNQAGISHIVNVGASLEGVQATVELTEAYPFLYGAVGVHPGSCGKFR